MTIDVFSRGNETADGNSANGSWTTGELLLATMNQASQCSSKQNGINLQLQELRI